MNAPRPLTVFARFDARPGREQTLEASLRAIIGPSRAEPGCISIELHRSILEPRRYVIHSVWNDQEAFVAHAELPHMAKFLAEAGDAITHPLDVSRCERIE